MSESIILIIEDEDLQFAIYEEVLAEHKLVRVKNGTAALQEIKRQRPDLLILDHILAEGELGLRFLPQFKELIPFVPVIIISGALGNSSGNWRRCRGRGAHTIAYPSRWIYTICGRLCPLPLPNAANGRPCASLRRLNDRTAWTPLSF